MVQDFLSKFGLAITDKCQVLAIGTKCKEVNLGGVVYKPVSALRFLGLKVTSAGTISPWRDDFT